MYENSKVCWSELQWKTLYTFTISGEFRKFHCMHKIHILEISTSISTSSYLAITLLLASDSGG